MQVFYNFLQGFLSIPACACLEQVNAWSVPAGSFELIRQAGKRWKPAENCQ